MDGLFFFFLIIYSYCPKNTSLKRLYVMFKVLAFSVLGHCLSSKYDKHSKVPEANSKHSVLLNSVIFLVMSWIR